MRFTRFRVLAAGLALSAVACGGSDPVIASPDAGQGPMNDAGVDAEPKPDAAAPDASPDAPDPGNCHVAMSTSPLSVDPTFHTWRMQLPTGGTRLYPGAAAAVDSRRRLVAMPMLATPPTPRAMFVRLTATGDLDATFGPSGIVSDTSGRQVTGTFALDAHDRVIYGGQAPTGFYLQRLTESGVPDATFGSGGTGRITVQTPGTASPQTPDGIFMDGDEVLVTCASGLVARVDATGRPVTAFMTRGAESIANSGPAIFIGAVATVSKYGRNGDLDATFGMGGKVELPSPSAQLSSVLSGANGSVFVLDPVTPSIVLFRADGSLDPQFGNAGSVALGFPAPTQLVRRCDGAMIGIGLDDLPNVTSTTITASGARVPASFRWTVDRGYDDRAAQRFAFDPTTGTLTGVRADQYPGELEFVRLLP